jgi:hypothetical protein
MTIPHRDLPSRRRFLTRTLGGLAAIPTSALLTAQARAERLNPVQAENLRPGHADWRLDRPRIEGRFRSPGLEGYASHTSIRAGQTLELFVSTRPASAFQVDIYRMGYYGGAGARKVYSAGPLRGEPQADPPVGPKRVRDCRWRPALRLKIPRDWLSGVYLAKLSAPAPGPQSYAVFIVRDARRAALLFQCSDFTWQAYNRWPDHFALYDDGQNEWYWGGGVQVGFNRPYAQYCQAIVDSVATVGSGEFLLWEYPFAWWLEREGFDVTYGSNLDTHERPETLRRVRGFLSVGHDEYWTREMFRNVAAAVQQGVSAGFFSGNAVCGRIQLGPDAAGRPRRAFERVGVFGPPGGTHEFVAMSSLRHERPYANELVGAHSTGPVTGGADWTCVAPDHWIFAGTGLRQGDGIPGLVGWEWHGDPAPIPGLEIVASGPTQSAPGRPNGGHFTATVYPGPRGNFVFNASTIWWADGLAAPPGYHRPSVYTTPLGPDRRVQQITRNLLERMTGSARTAAR